MMKYLACGGCVLGIIGLIWGIFFNGFLWMGLGGLLLSVYAAKEIERG